MLGHAQAGYVAEYGRKRVVTNGFKRLRRLCNLLLVELIDQFMQLVPRIGMGRHGSSIAECSR